MVHQSQASRDSSSRPENGQCWASFHKLAAEKQLHYPKMVLFSRLLLKVRQLFS